MTREKIKLPKLELFLAKPDKTTVGKLKHIYEEQLSVKSDEVSELSFTLPYYILIDNKQVKNPHIKNVREKYLVKTVFREKTEWFTIESISKVSGETEELNVTAYSLGYQLQGQLVIDYKEISKNCNEVTEDILKGTGWKTGYINPKFNTKYRSFDITQGTKLSAIYEIRDTFESIVVFDTVNKTVSHYDEDEYSQYKGANIGYGKYIQNIEEKIDASEIVTRLHVYGSDGLQINSVNPTGQPYIDDFSYFLYPFEMDKEGNVIRHSYYMTDDLAKALVNYNKHVTNKKDDFSKLLEEKSKIQKELTAENNDLVELQVELEIILDKITIAKNNGESTSDLNKDKVSKNREINSKNKKIKELEKKIEDIDSQIDKLKDQLDMKTHLTDKHLDELSAFIQAEDWTDDNLFDVNDLYEAGVDKLEELNSPPINITTSIVNFLRMVGEKHNWDRFNIGEIIRIKHDRLGIDIKTTLSEIKYDFGGESIEITISNSKKDLTTEEIITSSHYKVGKVETELRKRKIDWNNVAYNFNIRNDRIKEIPTNPSSTVIKHRSNDDGSVNLVLNWDYPESEKTKKKEDNIDGFIIYMHSSGDDQPYQFTSKMSEETLISNIGQDTRTYTIASVPSNLFYTIGIRAYRRVDDDIDSSGILKSEIIGFNRDKKSLFRSAQRQVATVEMSDIDNPYKSYQPDVEVNVNARVNGSKITTSYDEPRSPIKNDLWIDLNENSLKIWDGNKWSGDIELNNLKDEFSDYEKYMQQMEKELQEELERSKAEVEEAMKIVDEEMDRIENEVIPRVEEAVGETTVPEGDVPPEDHPASGLWSDTSQEPPRLMRWDEEEGDWVPLAPNEQELKDMMDQMRDEAVVESQRYSALDILEARNDINEQLEKEIGDVNQHIKDLEDMAEGLKDQVSEVEEYVQDLKDTVGDDIENIGKIAEEMKELSEELNDLADGIQEQIGDYEGRIVNVEKTVDEIDGIIKTTVESIERIDGVVEKQQTSIEQNAEKIESKVDSVVYQEDKEGIIESVEKNATAIKQTSEDIELKADKESVDNLSGVVEQNSASIELNAESIKSKVEQSEYDELAGEVSDNKSAIEQTSESITQTVERLEKTESDLEKAESKIEQNAENISLSATKKEVELIEGEIESISESQARLEVDVEGITQEVSRVEEDLDGKITSNKTLIETTAKGINATIEDFQHEYDQDKTDILSSIERNRTSIEANSEAISARVTKEEFENGLAGISTSNMLSSLPSTWEKGDYNLDGDTIENNSNNKIRIKSGDAALLTPKTDYTFSSEMLDVYAGLGIEFFISVYKMVMKDVINFTIEKIVDGELFNEKITFNSGENSYKDVAEADFYYSNIIIVIDSKGALPSRTMLESLDDLRLMLNKGTAVHDYQPHSPDIIERITKSEATLDIHSESIELKADKSELTNYVGKKEYTNKVGELEVGIDGITSRVSKAEATVNKHTGEIDSARSQIAGVETKVNGITSTVSDLRSDLTKASSAISKVEQQAGKIESTVSEVRTDLDGLEIGARNYQKDTSNEFKTVTYSGWQRYISPYIPVGGSGELQVGDTITARYYIETGNHSHRLMVHFQQEGSSYTQRQSNPILRAGEKGYTYWTGVIPVGTKEIRLAVRSSSGSMPSTTIKYKELKLEKGNKATDWSPAPEDYYGAIDGIEVGTRNYVKNGNSVKTADKNYIGYDLHTPTIAELKDETVTISYEARTVTRDSDVVRVYWRGGSPTLYFKNQQITKDWKRYSVTTKITSEVANSKSTQIAFHTNSKNGSPLGTVFKGEFRNVKVEKGDKATDFTLAPEDIDSIIGKAQSDANKAQSGVDGLTGRMTSVETSIKQLPDEIDLAVKEGIGGIQIGGRNLIEDSTSVRIYSNNNSVYPIEDVAHQGHRRFRRTFPSGISDTELSTYTQHFYTTQEGKTYTESIKVKPEKTLILRLNREGKNTSCKGGEWTTLTYTYTTEKSGERRFMGVFGAGFSQNNRPWIEYKEPKAEKGNKATDWSPAPEDGVNKTNVLSSINLSKEGVKIQGAKIDIAGLVTVLNADGTAGTMIQGGKIVAKSITANQLNVNNIFSNSAVIGEIQAKSVKTADLSATRITTGTLDAGKVSVKNLSASVIITGEMSGARIKAGTLSANKITTGTLNGNNVNISNLNASNIKSGTLNASNITVQGGSGNEYTKIQGSILESRGKFTKTWFGQKETHDVRMRFAGGQMRAESMTDSRRLYYSHDGIATYYQGSNEDDDGGAGSGVIEFFSHMYDSSVRGLSLYSNRGTVGIRAATRDIILDAERYVTISNDNLYVSQIRTRASEKHMYIRASGDGGELRVSSKNTISNYLTVRAGGYHGKFLVAPNNFLYLGSDSGVRITSRGINNLESIVYRDVYAKNYYANGGRFFGNRLWSREETATVRSDTGRVYLQSPEEVRVTTPGTVSTYRPIRADSFPTGSSESIKENISKFEDSALDLINNSVIYSYNRRSTGNHELGFIIEREIPDVVKYDEESVNGYTHRSLNTKAIQELSQKVSQLKEQNNLKDSQILQLKQRIERLESLVG